MPLLPNATIPSHVLCVIGNGLDLDRIESIAREVGGPDFELDRDNSQNAPDPAMPAAFEASLTDGTFTETDRQAVREHDSVAYVLSPPMLGPTARQISRQMLDVTAALLRSYGTAAKNESSGIAHGMERWLRLAESDGPDVLYAAWVKRPIFDGEALYTCGMHLLDAPEIEVEVDGESLDERSVREHIELMDTLADYVLNEPRGREINDGEGFRLAQDAPRWILRKRPPDRYDLGDMSFNIYGSLRLVPDNDDQTG